MTSIVLKVIKYHTDSADIQQFGPLSTTIFVLYDDDKKEFRIHAIRHGKGKKYSSYSFYSFYDDAIVFLDYCFYDYDKLYICLANYDRIPNGMDFFIDTNILMTANNSEIVGYDRVDSASIDFSQLLDILSNVYNSSDPLLDVSKLLQDF